MKNILTTFMFLALTFSLQQVSSASPREPMFLSVNGTNYYVSGFRLPEETKKWFQANAGNKRMAYALHVEDGKLLLTMLDLDMPLLTHGSTVYVKFFTGELHELAGKRPDREITNRVRTFVFEEGVLIRTEERDANVSSDTRSTNKVSEDIDTNAPSLQH